jgi:hypothetical protein
MDKLEKLKGLLTMVNESLSRSEFELAFKTLMEFVKKFKIELTTSNEQTVKELTNLINSLSVKLEVTNGQKLGEAKSKLDEYNLLINKALKDQENGLNFIRDKVRKIKVGSDGINGRDGVNGVPGKDGSPDTPVEIRNKLETLQGEEKLHIEDIWQLQEELDKLRKLKTNNMVGGLRPSPTGVETPAGDINGVNKAYTVTFVPQYITLQGQAIYPDNGYVLSSSSGILTITLDDAPITGNILRSHY